MRLSARPARVREAGDSAAAARDEGGHDRIGQTHQRLDIERHHRAHRIDVGVKGASGRPDTCVIDQQGDNFIEKPSQALTEALASGTAFSFQE